MTAHPRGRRRGGGGGHGGGGGGHDGAGGLRWLLTYADLITLLMVFFVLMYSIAKVDSEKYSGLAQALHDRLSPPGRPAPPGARAAAVEVAAAPGAEAAGEPAGPPLPPPAKEEPAQAEPAQPPPAKDEPPAPPPAPPPDALAPIAHVLAGAPGLTGKAEVQLRSEGLVVSILGSVLFDPAQARLRPEAEALLGTLAAQLKELPNQVVVQGSTDSLPVSTPQFPSNWELSAARAAAVVRFFTGQGLAAPRFVAVGYADTRPAFDNGTEAGRAANQRVDVVILRQPLTLARAP